MLFPIEILCLGTDRYAHAGRAADTLNRAQGVFNFHLAEGQARAAGLTQRKESYRTPDIWAFLKDYRSQQRGHRPFIISVVDAPLDGSELRNLFGSHSAGEGLAAVTLQDQSRYEELPHKFLCYYLIRYALSFVAPGIASHRDHRACFYDKKIDKRDLLASLSTPQLCRECDLQLRPFLTPEMDGAFQSMMATLKSLPALDGKLTWLHLSDLHMCVPKSGWDARRVLKTLVADLQRMERDQGLSPDLIFFTGDLAYGDVGRNAGETLADQYREAAMFLEGVRTAFQREVPQANVYLVPGNHDVERQRVSPDQVAWLESQKSIDPIIEMMRKGTVQWIRNLERLGAYREFLSTAGYTHLLQTERLSYNHLTEVRGIKLGIAGLNSAWSCSRENEKGKLFLGRLQLEEAHAALESADIRIALMHHPVSWLHEFEDPIIQRDIERDFQFLLHGHEHQDWLAENVDGHARIAAGACYESSQRKNAYNFVRLDFVEGVGEAWLRTYDARGGGWIPALISGKTNDSGLWTLRHLKWMRERSFVTSNTARSSVG